MNIQLCTCLFVCFFFPFLKENSYFIVCIRIFTLLSCSLFVNFIFETDDCFISLIINKCQNRGNQKASIETCKQPQLNNQHKPTESRRKNLRTQYILITLLSKITKHT